MWKAIAAGRRSNANADPDGRRSTRSSRPPTERLNIRYVTKCKELLRMPRGRPPQGQQALTGAERQARWRARHAGAPAIRYRRPTDRRSRPQRWRDAIAELVVLQDEYTQWFEALPEALRDTATGEALQAIADFDLDELAGLEPP